MYAATFITLVAVHCTGYTNYIPSTKIAFIRVCVFPVIIYLLKTDFYLLQFFNFLHCNDVINRNECTRVIHYHTRTRII